MGAVVQTPASAPAITISVVVQSHAAGVCDHQTWTLVPTQLKRLLIRNGHLQIEMMTCVIDVFFFSFFFNLCSVRCRTHHLQPVVETVWALLTVDALDVKAVAEVQRDGEADWYRNDVPTGQGLWFQTRVSGTGQVSLWLTK